MWPCAGRRGALGPAPSGLLFRPIGYRPGAPWGEAVAAASLEALPGGEARCSEPNKRPVTKAAAGQLEAAGLVWGAGPGPVWDLGASTLPSFGYSVSWVMVAP